MEIVDQMELESFFGLRYGVSFADFLVNSIVSCKKKIDKSGPIDSGIIFKQFFFLRSLPSKK